MRERNLVVLIVILALTALAVWIDLPIDHPDWASNLLFWQAEATRDMQLKQGLDLQGGLQVLLEADVPAGEELPPGALDAVEGIIDSRVNALGVTEPLIQSQGDRRIIVELPGIDDPDLAISTLKGTGLLEFVDTGSSFFEEGVVLQTSLGTDEAETPVADDGDSAGEDDAQIYTTVMSGRHLKTAAVSTDELGRPQIGFELTSDGAQIFAEHTRANIGQVLCITMDKAVISCPRIESVIPDGQGRITSQGGFSLEYARGLAVQMRYGALPVPMKVVNNRSVGATLGQDSVQKSITAGLVGLSVVLLFMLSYYRLPGLLADFALVIYALLNLAAFKLLPVVLTLPGIAGFLLSTGMAVDANVLIFERMKEELRAKRPLGSAIEAGFSRAWTSILDSNLSTLITCAILYYFGGAFGASTVRGFALTLGIGVLISMFTAVVVTRTFVRFVFEVAGNWLRDKRWLLGV